MIGRFFVPPIVAMLVAITARADYYPQYYYNRGPSRPPIISLTLDPQECINTSFRIAAREERDEDMLRFLDNKADINSRSEEGATALMYVSRNCAPTIAKTLLARGADAGLEDLHGRTALIYAAQESCSSVIEILLQSRRVRIHHKDKLGKTAIDYAIENSRLEEGGPTFETIHLLDVASLKKKK